MKCFLVITILTGPILCVVIISVPNLKLKTFIEVYLKFVFNGTQALTFVMSTTKLSNKTHNN